MCGPDGAYMLQFHNPSIVDTFSWASFLGAEMSNSRSITEYAGAWWCGCTSSRPCAEICELKLHCVDFLTGCGASERSCRLENAIRIM